MDVPGLVWKTPVTELVPLPLVEESILYTLPVSQYHFKFDGLILSYGGGTTTVTLDHMCRSSVPAQGPGGYVAWQHSHEMLTRGKVLP